MPMSFTSGMRHWFARSDATRRRRDVRLATLAGMLGAIGLAGLLIHVLSGSEGVRGRLESMQVQDAPRIASASAPGLPAREQPDSSSPRLEARDPHADPDGHRREAVAAEVRARFDQAVLMLHAGRFDEAIVALDRLLRLEPEIPEGYVNMGYALLGKGDYKAANAFFQTATEINPGLANAYYGMAIAQEGMGSLEGAIGGMRTFLHLNENRDHNQIHNARARSAIWEWEARLGRGAWGATRGVPPGFTEDELKRDGRGVGIKIPIPGTEQPDGSMSYEVKHQDVFPMFKP